MENEILERLSVFYLKKEYNLMVKEHLGHVEIVKRIDRAMDILTRDQSYVISLVKNKPLTFQVTSSNDSYTVIDKERLCTCPDTTVLCKHRIVVKLILNSIRSMKDSGLTIKKGL